MDNTDMSAFTFEDDNNSFAFGTSLPKSISYKVNGYWSGRTVTISSPSFISESVEYYVNYASGGRDTDEVKSDLEAIENFSKALTHAIQRAKELTAEYRKQTE